jgi:hypothetical protein
MKKVNVKITRFTDRIRIDPKQKEYVRGQKGKYRTMAGRLDEIINHYKKCKVRKSQAKVGTGQIMPNRDKNYEKAL